MNIGMILLMIIGGVAGLFSTLYIMISLPYMIIKKIIRTTRYGISIFD